MKFTSYKETIIMKKLLPVFLFTILLFTTTDAKSQNSDKSEIEKLIQNYQEVLNSSDVNAIIALYTENAVLLPNAAPTADGLNQVKQTYEYVFENFTYTLKFTVLEIETIGNTAYVRSNSSGNVHIKASGETVTDQNRELFILKKQNDTWKIARYMYNKGK